MLIFNLTQCTVNIPVLWDSRHSKTDRKSSNYFKEKQQSLIYFTYIFYQPPEGAQPHFLLLSSTFTIMGYFYLTSRQKSFSAFNHSRPSILQIAPVPRFQRPCSNSGRYSKNPPSVETDQVPFADASQLISIEEKWGDELVRRNGVTNWQY
jgi:hypothetical protein